MCQTFRQAAGTGLCLSIDRPSLQFAVSVVEGRGSAVQVPSRAEETVCVHGHGLGSGRADQEICIVHFGEVRQSHA